MFGVKTRMRNSILLSLAVLLLTAGSASAGGDWSITDGMGEEISIKNPWLGKKSKVFKDRLGNSYVQEQGLLGGTTTEFGVLGNRFEKKKGIFGGSQVEGSTILGDKVVSKKGIFRRRKTQVDLSGTTALIRGLIGRSSANGSTAIQQRPPAQESLPDDARAQP